MSNLEALNKMLLPKELEDLLRKGDKTVIIPETKEELFDLALGGKDNDSFDVCYDVNGEKIREATVVKCKNGLAVNFDDLRMRRRDPNAMVIADSRPTDKTTYFERFGREFKEDRLETFEWLDKQDTIILVPFYAGNISMGIGYETIAVIPGNTAFFAAIIAELQGFLPASKVPNVFKPRAAIYVAPPFRHTRYDGKQVVVHNRSRDMHEVFSYNLYPGPSAKKGVYSILLDFGEQEGWVTLHASTVKIVTPYELTLTIMHEGASGGGKSEMTEQFHRQPDGRFLLAHNTVNGEDIYVNINDSSELHPVTDDMALAHPSLQKKGKKLSVCDAEFGWFLRVDNITGYGTDYEIEKSCTQPPEPLIFLNMQAVPNSTCLIWEHIEDAPGKPCSNPRVIMPRHIKKNIVKSAISIDIRSFGVRTPPTTRDNPNYGIIGLFHVLPPALAWLWRLVAPRGYANPSIIDKDKNKMKAEGVGSYWPFSTGKKVDQANLLLKQILDTPSTRYILIPNQYIGAYKVGFYGQWAVREYLSRRGGCKFAPESLNESKCPILGYSLESIKIDGQVIPKGLLQVDCQREVGEEGFSAGAKILTDFFKEELNQFLVEGLDPLGRKIIETCLNDGTVKDYYNLIPKL